MLRRNLRPLAACAALLALTTVVGLVAAGGEPTSDAAAAAQALAELPQADAGDGGATVAAPVAEARRALERARGARASGDARHAEQLEGLAREWAELARDQGRAVAAEATASATQAALGDAGVAAERSRALLDQAVVRRAQAEAAFERARAAADGGASSGKPRARGGR